MISPDVQVLDMHPEHWARLLRSFTPPEGLGRWALVLHRDGRVVHAVGPGLSLDSLLRRACPPAGELRRRLGLDRVVLLEQGALRRILDRADAQLALSQDFVLQLLVLWQAARSERGRGLSMDPPAPLGPPPPVWLLQRLFDAAWPDETCLVLYVVDEDLDSLFASLIVRKRSGDLDLISSDRIFAEDGLRPEDWRKDRTRLLELMAQRVAPCHAACFCSLEAWRIFLRGRLGSGELARQRALDNWIMEPLPWSWALALRAISFWSWACAKF